MSNEWESFAEDVPAENTPQGQTTLALPAILSTDMLKEWTRLRDEMEELKLDSDNIWRAQEIAKKGDNAVKMVREAMRDAVIPLENEITVVKKPYQEFIVNASDFVAALRSKILAFQVAERNRQEKAIAEQKAAKLAELDKIKKEALEDGDLDAATEVIAEEMKVQNDPRNVPTRTYKGLSTTSTIKKRWTYSVTNEKQVPREYCEPSRGLLKKAVESGVRKIRGVNIYQVDELSLR